MRKTSLEMVKRLAEKDERIVFLGSDLGVGTLEDFRQEMPDRFFMEGVSEANLVGMAAGLAMEGKIPYVNTIATFLSRRCFEQIVLDMGLHEQKVRLIANGGGLVYAPLGPTHLAIDDIAILRTVPNMTIIAPADAEEMRRVIPKTVDHPGPIYIRLAKGHDPIVTTPEMGFEIGKAALFARGKDSLLITTGIAIREAQAAAAKLSKEGHEATIIHCPTLKPFDSETVIDLIASHPIVITIEEHTVIGGLGSIVAELIAENPSKAPRHFQRIGIPDTFPYGYGSQQSLMEDYGICADGIIKAIRHSKT